LNVFCFGCADLDGHFTLNYSFFEKSRRIICPSERSRGEHGLFNLASYSELFEILLKNKSRIYVALIYVDYIYVVRVFKNTCQQKNII